MRGEGGRVRAPLLHEWGPVRGPRLPRPRSHRRPGRALRLLLPARILVGTPGLAGGLIAWVFVSGQICAPESYSPTPPVRHMFRLQDLGPRLDEFCVVD